MAVRIGVDTGGTFTDLVLAEEGGARRTVKVASTPARPADAVFEALARCGAAPADVASFVLGTTIATNALLERKGQRVVYVTTAGFEDVPFIQRINRRHLFDLQWVKATPYVARRDCVGARERIAYDGSVRIPLEPAEAERVVAEVARRDSAAEGGVAVAVNLLFAYAEPAHERALAEALRAALPHAPLAVSHEVAPIWREYERGNTAIVDAYLRRLVGHFADELESGLAKRGFVGGRSFLKSNGGQVPMARAARQPVSLVLSGLAGGLTAGRVFAEAVGAERVFTLDMGGTSADVGVVVDGRVRSSSQVEFEWGLPVATPVVDLSTIGAGGSSIAGFDQGGFLKVGPESAGADPGPAAYGTGGTAATVTDANLVLGRLNPDYFLGGELRLDPERARRALETVAARLGLSVEEAAQAVVDVAVENMANAIRLVAAERGLDYRRFSLMAFGGAGPLHAQQLAERVGLKLVLVPPSPGLASAFGALAGDLRVDRQLTLALRSDFAGDDELRAALRRLAREALEELREEGAGEAATVATSISCRYQQQNFEQEVPVPLDATVELVVARFHEAHERTYGYRIDGAVVELVHLNAIAVEPRETTPTALEPGGEPEPVDVRPVYWREGWVETTVYRRAAFGSGSAVVGPAVIEEVDSTTLVPADHVARTHPSGTLVLAAIVSRGSGVGEEWLTLSG